jgi:hypothetical protein
MLNKVRYALRRALLVASVLLLGPGTSAARAAFLYTTIDHPLAGIGGTTPNDVEGDRIVGAYLDADGGSHGFLYDGVTWTTLDHPDAAAPRGTAAYGISGGTICGSFVDATGRTFGFLYDGANWTTFQHPPLGVGAVDTFARGISDGTVVGYYIESLVARGFAYRAGTFTDVTIPPSVGTFPQDVDGARIVGTYDDAIGTHGFVLDGGIATTLDHPLGIPLGTFVNGVDGSRLVGNYLDLSDGSSHGFLFDGNGYTPIDVPGATDTAVTGVYGTRLVGTYADTAGVTHGFVTTVPEPGGVMALLLVASPTLLRARRRLG